MLHYTVPSHASRKVREITRATIRRFDLEMATRIASALSEPTDERNQSQAENAALSSALYSEACARIRIECIMLGLLRSVVYRSLREERSACERLGVPAVTLEALHDARLYAAGVIAGESRANSKHAQRQKALDIRNNLSYTPKHDESVRDCDLQDQ